MSIDIAISIAWDVLKCVVAPIKRGFGYVRSSKTYVQELQKEVRKLEHEAVGVHNAVQVARNNLRIVHGQVTEWQDSVEKALKEAEDLLGDSEMASKSCCYGTLPDPNCRYQFSKKAEDKIKDIKKLAQEGREFKGSDNICSSAPAPGDVNAPTQARRKGKAVIKPTMATASTSFASTSSKHGDDGLFESRAAIIRDIMIALADKSNSVIGIHGMGGVGKSTLLVDAERRIKDEKMFDWVAKADVSENPNIRKIQGEIADDLGLTDIENKEHDSSRAKLLHKRLEDDERENKKVLIILDNLWEGLDLKSVGIPCGHDNKVRGCKLLLTSRNQIVLQEEMGCDKEFLLDRLEDEEAKILFERIVGDKVYHEEFKTLVDETLHKCAGLPFLIVAMAKHSKNVGRAEWKDALKQFDVSKNKGIGEILNKMLRFSYDYLKNEEKLLLQLCVVYGDSKPSLENLVRSGMGLGLFGEDSSMEDARNRLRSLIHTLRASSLLLEDGKDDGFKIHDFVREFVVYITSRDHPLLVFKDKDKSVTKLPKDKLKSCWAIYFPNIDMKELPEELECPELQIFFLFTKNKVLNVPYSYFNSMRKLAVLHLTGIRITHSPSPFRLLENLHTLCLDCCLLDDVAILGKLKGLQILSFVRSQIQQLPKEIGQLAELRLLDLNYCFRLEIIEPGVLGSLIKLEELYIENSFNRWNAVEQTPPTNASLIELNNMENLCTLHICIPDPRVLPEDLNVEKLTKYRIQIGGERWWPSEYKGSRTLKLKLDPRSNILQKGYIQKILDKTDDLALEGSNGDEQSICELSREVFPKLMHLHVKNNPLVQYILRWPYLVAALTPFEMLESLLLEKLINLKKICHSHTSSKSFNTLRVVRIKSCDKIEILFPFSLVRKLLQLEEIEIDNCNLMREIVEADDCVQVELCKFHVLVLRDLPSIKNFFTIKTAPSSSTSNNQVGTQVAFFNGQQISIPSLESLTMERLPNLKELWSDESLFGLNNLQSLKVVQCKSFSKVINFESLVKLQKLHTLSISSCNLLQEIFLLDGPSANGDFEIPSELTTLGLHNLGSLRCIWNKNPCGIVSFHKLKKLEAYDCPDLRFMFFPSMVKSLTQLRDLTIQNCEKMEVIIMGEEGLVSETSGTLAFPMLTNLCLQRLTSLMCFSRRRRSREAQSQDCIESHSTALFNREISFPSLESLTMEGLPHLKEIWSDESPLELRNLHKLHHLDIRDCNSVQEIFNVDGPSTSGEVKTLYELRSLRCIMNKNPGGTVSFHNLESLKVSNCPNLRFMFFPSMVKSLTQLRNLVVRDCQMMEAIIMEEEGLGLETSETLTFPMLTNLFLQHLASLMCFSRRKYSREAQSRDCIKSSANALFSRQVAFPSLETLYIFGIDNIEMIWDNQAAADSYPKLNVSCCDGLSSTFTPAIAGNLMAVTNLWIKDCRMLTEVISDAGSKEGHVVAFNHLQHIRLDGLRRLRCFSSGGYTLRFPLLKHFLVTTCPNIKFFSKGPIEASKLERVRVSADVWFWKENLNVTIQNMFEELGTLVGVEFMRLSEFPEVIEKWHSKLTPSKSYWQLKSLVVDKCPSFVNAIPSRLMLVLKKMSTLRVCDCELLEEIFDLEGIEAVESTQLMPSFATLNLVNLPMLRRLWNKDLQGTLCFSSLRNLTIYKCRTLRHAFALSMARCLANLDWMEIRECGQMEEVIAEEEGQGCAVEKITFSKLKQLKLECLPNLTSFLLGNNHTLCFSSLRNLTIYKCRTLRHAFALSMARSLANLDWMEIRECGQMEEVIAEEEGQGCAVEKITFSKLKQLKLECLPNLTSFLLGNNHTLECPFLHKLTITHCPKMRSLTGQSLMEIDHGTPSLFSPQVQFPQLKCIVLSHMDNLSKIWTDSPQETLTFDNLREVEVWNCKSLEKLFPHWVATSLTQLKELRVESCGIEQMVIGGDGTPHSNIAHVLFPQLTYLVLHDMPQLQSFYANLPTLNWPFLKELRVTHCDTLNMLSFAASMNNWAQRDDRQDLLDQEAHSSFERDFPKLERLLLVNNNIQMMQDGNFPNDIFGKPKALTLACFHHEKAVFPPRFLLERFQNLQSFEVFCSSFEDIFPDEGLVDEGKHQVLENLRELKLNKLHKLKSVWKEDSLVSKILRSIETFKVWDCPSLTTIFPVGASFQNLTELVVKNSSGLVHLVTVSTVTNLVRLRFMTIIGCERMKEVLANDGNGEGKVISFKNLRGLTLQHLPSLECFSSIPSCTFGLPFLFNVQVEECPKMKTFSNGTLSTPRLGYLTLFRYHWQRNWREEGDDLNTIIKKLSA